MHINSPNERCTSRDKLQFRNVDNKQVLKYLSKLIHTKITLIPDMYLPNIFNQQYICPLKLEY